MDYKEGFVVKNAKMNLFRSAKQKDRLDPIDVKELLYEMKIDGLMGMDNLTTQANHAEGSRGKST